MIMKSIMKNSRKKRAVLLITALLMVCFTVFGLNIGISEVRADGAYTVTFQAQAGHALEVDNASHLVIDGQYVELRNSSNQSIGEVALTNATTATITVNDGTESEINYGGNSFTLYNTNGHVAYVLGTKISSNTVFYVEDYSNGGSPAPAQNADVGKFNVHIDQRMSSFTGEVWIEFYNKNNPTVLLNDGGNPYAYTENATNVAIPAGTNRVVISFPEAKRADCLKYYKNGWFEINRGSQHFEFDAFDEMRREDNNEHIFVMDSGQTIFTGAQNSVQGMDIDPSIDSLNFRFEFDDTRNVSWSYNPSAPADQYVEHCRIYKLAGDDPSTVMNGTDFNLKIGEDFYFLLVPDYGYQVDSLLVNGYLQIQPMNNMGVFKFSMIDSNFHFNAMVKPMEDLTDASGASKVSEVSIANGANATANGGNLKVTVSDAPTENVSALTSGVVLSTVDIDLDNIVSKDGTMNNVWSTDVTEFNDDVDVTLKLQGTQGDAFSVVRNHNGELTKINATYDATTQSITFPSNRFSTYTIVQENAGYTGMALVDGIWRYFVNNQVDWTYTGMACNEYGWWYFRDGLVDFNYTGMACNEAGWWYFRNGQLDWTYTGMACNEYGWWYYTNGQLDWTYTGMACNEYGWWYYTNGQLDWTYTGMACNEYGWWYYRDGQIDWTYTGMACNEYGWWYYTNGQLDWTYTGWAHNEFGDWYYVNGRLVV